jgi:hypothetical protein
MTDYQPFIYNDIDGNSLTFHGGAEDDDRQPTVAVEADQIGRGTAWVHVRHTDAARVADELRAAAGLSSAPAARAALVEGVSAALEHDSVRCPLCLDRLVLHTPDGARAHFEHVHPEQQITGPGVGPWPMLVDRAADAEAPLSPYYEHPECGFHWHGRDGMDIPMRDGQPVCPRCELAAVEKALRHSEKRSEELRAESRRRGKVKLEYAEQIRQLEKKLDEVRMQLGAEILRAGEAEAGLRRVADETPVHAVPVPGSNGISACCGRPPCEFVGERVTRDPAAVTCPGPAVGAQQPKEA